MNDKMVPAGVGEEVSELAGMPTALEISLDTQKAVARIQAINQVIDGAVKVAIARTNTADWVRMKSRDGNQKFYCQASGIQKMRAVFGIYYRDRQVTKEVHEDGHYSYETTGIVGSMFLDKLYGETTLEIIGGRSSKDPFFTGKGGDIVPDPTDVKKAALANWEVRAVTALLGLGNMTEEDLKKNGIDTSKVGTFEFKSGSLGGGQEGLASEAQLRLLMARWSKVGKPESVLQSYLKDIYKIDSRSNIKRDDFSRLLEWVDAGAPDWKGGSK